MKPIERFFQSGLKLSHLRLLTMFASLGQVRLIAQRLNVTQPAISKQLAELEAGLGAPVLVRVGNRLQFTALGETLLKHAREVLHQLEQARYEADALCSGISGKIAVGAVATVMPVFAPELVLQIKKRAPNVDIAFFEATSDRLFPMLTAGDLDFVFSRKEAPAELGASKFAVETLLDDPIVIVCGRDHPLAARRHVAPADIAGMPWILPPREAPITMALSRWMQQHGLEFPPGCVQSISLAVNEAILKSAPFLGLMPLAVTRRLAHRGDIKVIPFPGTSLLGAIRLFYNRETANPVVGIALECVADVQAGLFAQHGPANASA
ncbi:LysR family transcriptional regulator [Pandoraea sp.]|uniref:LysR family transcriptional regulator n=1 Tax=Pandoraea sp. TaxID=1883445 RepID=UPI00121181B8|nr:LysR family transcriptional regulator [Pandoraea sp.]TAL54671.1 MAG: LysR family transcriptional regulator [Pandoraea sp.]TAM18561.1 MAG: LysR family transcriptional regulator [Pandoraea sp.]